MQWGGGVGWDGGAASAHPPTPPRSYQVRALPWFGAQRPGLLGAVLTTKTQMCLTDYGLSKQISKQTNKQMNLTQASEPPYRRRQPRA